MHPFDGATAVTPSGPHRWRGPTDPAWFGGNGPHGGHLAAQLLRALCAEAGGGDGFCPRSLTVHYASRARPGVLEIETHTERRGRSLCTLSARATQDGRLVAIALAAIGRERPGPELREAELPALPPPDQLRGPSTRAQGAGPRVSDHYDVRFAVGRPLSGEAARAGGWIRPHEPRRPDHLLTAALADLWMPPVFVRLAERVPTTTVELTVNFLEPPGPTPADTWYLTLFQSPGAAGGYFREEGEVWTAGGRLLARCSQLGAFLGGP